MTPSANEDAAGTVDGKMQRMLTHQAKEWPTPASDSFRSRGGERKDEMGLDQQARTFWATVYPYSHQAPETPTHGSESSQSTPTSRRQLNPRFVEWLMGWRPGWTSLAPLSSGLPATGLSPSAPVSPSAPSGDNWGGAVEGAGGSMADAGHAERARERAHED